MSQTTPSLALRDRMLGRTRADSEEDAARRIADRTRADQRAARAAADHPEPPPEAATLLQPYGPDGQRAGAGSAGSQRARLSLKL